MCPAFLVFGFSVISGVIYCINRLLRRQRLPVSGKAVFITGCDRGFGHQLTTKLAQNGYYIYAGCLDIEGEGAKTLRTIPNVSVLQLDVTNDASVEKATSVLNQDLWEKGGLWAVVNNAGVAVFAESEWCTMAAYEKVLGVNVMGMIRVTKACLPLIRRAKGRVISISSLAGRISLPGFTAYSASKSAMIGYADSLRREMFKFGVKVITLEPRLYRTAISDGDFHVQTNMGMWAESKDCVKLDYGDTYLQTFLAKMLDDLKMSSRKTYQVTDDLEHAISARYPYKRYVPSLKWQIVTDMFMAMPLYMQDRVMKTIMKVDCVPCSMRKRMDSIS